MAQAGDAVLGRVVVATSCGQCQWLLEFTRDFEFTSLGLAYRINYLCCLSGSFGALLLSKLLTIFVQVTEACVDDRNILS